MKKNIIIWLIVIALLLVVSSIFYLQYGLIFKENHQGFAKMQEIRLTETQIQEVESIFNNTSNVAELKAYCKKERASCIYYCRNLNKNNIDCNQIFKLIKSTQSK